MPIVSLENDGACGWRYREIASDNLKPFVPLEIVSRSLTSNGSRLQGGTNDNLDSK